MRRREFIKGIDGAAAWPPVQRSTRIETAVHLKTARALGINVLPRMLVLADEVIE
jgi:hypothetical protein